MDNTSLPFKETRGRVAAWIVRKIAPDVHIVSDAVNPFYRVGAEEGENVAPLYAALTLATVVVRRKKVMFQSEITNFRRNDMNYGDWAVTVERMPDAWFRRQLWRIWWGLRP